MAVIMGRQGYVWTAVSASATSAAISINAWSLDAAADAIDVTVFGAGTAVTTKSFDYGLKSSTGTLSGDFDSTCSHIENIINMMADATIENVELQLHAAASRYFTCDALVTGFTMSQTVADKTTFSINFTVDGALTWTSA